MRSKFFKRFNLDSKGQKSRLDGFTGTTGMQLLRFSVQHRELEAIETFRRAFSSSLNGENLILRV